MIWDYYLVERSLSTIDIVLENLFGILQRQFQVKPKAVECDNEILREGIVASSFLHSHHIKVESSAPNTQAQNGGAEASGRAVKMKARAMRIGARLPEHLWVEIYRAAVYLYNRTPKYMYSWRTPYDRFHTALAHRDGIVVQDRKPHQAHLRVYGCKAYAMTSEAQLQQRKKQKLNPKAWIGFLVGYQSTNIYRIWNPQTGRIIATRDVIFNEDELFNGNINQLRDDILHIGQQELIDLLKQVEEPETDRNATTEDDLSGAVIPETWDGLQGEDESVATWLSREDAAPQEEERDAGAEQLEAESDQPAGTDEGSGTSGDVEVDQGKPEGGSEDRAEAGTDDQAKNSDAQSRPYLSPVSLPPTALLVMAIRDDVSRSRVETRRCDNNKDVFEVWKAAFSAGRQATLVGLMDGKKIDKAKLQRLLKTPDSLHRRQMPPLPRSHAELRQHPMGTIFEAAEQEHLRSHSEMRSWIEINRQDSRAKDCQVLDCMWVYVYKFDKHGRFQKGKARLVVRGDQQAKPVNEETYAATLAGRSFRTLMAIAARFDLELIQYDAVNAFVNARLDTNVFMRMPPGYRKPGIILMLQKALYGLRESPLLWQRDLTATLKEIGFESVPHEPCCMTRGSIIIFFYVDDIVLAYRKQKENEVQKVTTELRKRYEMTGGKPLQWFLGIEVLRDRKKNLIWLSQSDYIDKIANLAEDIDQRHDVPIRREELRPYEPRAVVASVRRYQRKIGSILYAAVITRPDVAFAASKLARFNANPGPEHHKAADRVLLYLRKTASLALRFGGGDEFIVASDASFADDTEDRKSSQAYVMRLFGGTIGWKANKQATVTTSTTEAELLALAQAAKEAMFISRLLAELGVQLDEGRIRIQCDNLQTIQLVNKDITKMQTKLRHVDIHNHWLRQEAQMNRIKVEYQPTTDMIADGLTKPMHHASLERFVEQIGLADISTHLKRRKLPGLEERELLSKMGKLDLDPADAPVSA
ncbi:Retrovirus-related Pol polyprotein from transposon TNT [Colletotrichum fructicola Nara gc5]|uniref:Retrovirus-related Pol polyprotein from transposon TNT n=1 Tax=Colletotrichum fructicola (strain Nara gc5) TaxID=1213859 RepID=A0A7J6IDY4_COLFN|nr:Retrovirus-related Pol polyprotein from transposon TNT [Colletotrichum fructicola Nara gc5]